jgi:hypothetical protein
MKYLIAITAVIMSMWGHQSLINIIGVAILTFYTATLLFATR